MKKKPKKARPTTKKNPPLRRHARAVSVSRVRAASIALARVAQQLLRCQVSETLPTDYHPYGNRPLPKNCWFVTCSPADIPHTGGPYTLICVSKRTGRVLLATAVQSE